METSKLLGLVLNDLKVNSTLLFLILTFCSFLGVLKCFIQVAYGSDVCALAKQNVAVLHHHHGLSDWYLAPFGNHGCVANSPSQ